MGRRHEAVEATLARKIEGTRSAYHLMPVELRLIRGNKPGIVDFLIPDAYKYTEQKQQQGFFGWSLHHVTQVYGIDAVQFAAAIATRGGSFKGEVHANIKNPETDLCVWSVDIRVERGREEDNITVLVPQGTSWVRQTRNGGLYDWRDATRIERIPKDHLIRGLKKLGQVSGGIRKGFRVPENAPFGKAD